VEFTRSRSFVAPAARTIRPTSDPHLTRFMPQRGFCRTLASVEQVLASSQCFGICSPRICELEQNIPMPGILGLCRSAEAVFRLLFVYLIYCWHQPPYTWYEMVPTCCVRVRQLPGEEKFAIRTGAVRADACCTRNSKAQLIRLRPAKGTNGPS
jgi:hypothetical protein